jgi:hypothetical protein
MKKLLVTLPLALAVAALAAAALPLRAAAAVNVDVHIGLPVAPPLVVVSPGVQVVEDYDEEVFFTSGYYWVRRDGGWYRARRPRAAFVYVQPRVVPRAIVHLPPGQYVRYKKAKHERHEHRHHGDRHDDHGGRGHGHGKHKHEHR